MLKRLFNTQSATITSAAVIIGAASLASRLLGVLRDRILAGQFGAGETLDMYYAAFRIPDFIFNLVVLGALSAGFIPVFVDYLENNKETAWRLVNNLINVGLIFLLLVCGLLIILTPKLIAWLTPGFDLYQISITSHLTRIMFLSPILLGLSGIFSGVLQSVKKFFIYSLAPIFYNLGIIFGALFIVPSQGVDGLAWGVVLGAFMHALIQLPAIRQSGFVYYWLFDLKDAGLKKILKMMVPRALALITGQINLIVVTIIASTLVAGSIAVFNLANNLQSFPLGVFGLAYAIAAFPSLAVLAGKKDTAGVVETFSSACRQIMFFIVPASVLLIVLRAQIIRVILGSGLFDWQDTIMAADTLALFSASLFAQAVLPLLARVFFAYHDSRTPFVIGLISAGVNVVLSFMLGKQMGVAGLALAFSVSSVINLILLWLALRLELGGLDEKRIFISLAKFLTAGLMMALVVQGGKYIIGPQVSMSTFGGVLAQGLAAGSVGLVIYFFTGLLLRSPEMLIFKEVCQRRLFRKKLPVGLDETAGR
ncbi:MAG: murein biosynthesis integral membrane protein MurJ [bacterium]